ncbi:DNase I-like protein, partial [Coprinellus micaceus]
INALMRDRSINILALQETHLMEEKVAQLGQFQKRLRILCSPDPQNPSGKGGVALVINKHNTNWKEVEEDEIYPGRAILATIKWKEDTSLGILAVYAPSGNDTENAAFWKELQQRLARLRRRGKRVDVLLGNFNMVEWGMNDRTPPRNEAQTVLNAFEEMKRSNDLHDGWREVNPNGRTTTFTSAPHHETGLRSYARLDRIYVRGTCTKWCDEWEIKPPGLRSDHDMVLMLLTPKGMPYVGGGRPAHRKN